MSKKVLILSASPRKGGNSDLLCDQFMLGAKEAGNQAEKIFLRDKEIGYCIGCGSCFASHECVQTDDMDEVLEKMIAAEVIVMATPVYFYLMAAQMKTLIDRTCPRYAEISNKEIYFIVAAADSRKRQWKNMKDSEDLPPALAEQKKRVLSMELVPGIWETSKKAEQWFRHMKWEKQYD